MIRDEADKVKKQELEHEKQIYQMKTEGYTEPVLKAMVLESTEKIYRHLGIKDMKVVNVSGGGQGS